MPSQPIPSVFRHHHSNLNKDRPASLAELSVAATSGANLASLQIESRIPITRYLIGSETLTRQAETCIQHDDIEGAFIALVKNCKLLIEILPSQHAGYESLDAKTKQKIKEKGQWNLDQLGQVKRQVVDRYEEWRKDHPNMPLNDATAKTQIPPERVASLKPVPSTGVMHNERHITPISSSSSSVRSIEYARPERAGFDVRDILGGAATSVPIRPPLPSSLIPGSTSQIPTRQSSSSSSDSAFSSLSYPTLRPADSIRMNNHQVSQGFAPRSEETYRYYQIQRGDEDRRANVAFPKAHVATAQPPRPLPMPLPSHQSSGFQYPTIKPSSHSSRYRAPLSHSVEQEAVNLLRSGRDTRSDGTQSIRGATTEGGEQLRTLLIPASLISTFVKIAERNTRANLETCGLLMGTIDANMLQVNHLLIPKQSASSDRCDTQDEEGIWTFMESRGLVTLGWCHTHPQQSCFMSSLDLHTHSAYQATLPEAIAIVCAPNDEPSFGLFRLTSPFGLQTILTCREPGLFHPHVTNTGRTIEAIYTDAINGHVILADAPLAVTDLR